MLETREGSDMPAFQNFILPSVIGAAALIALGGCEKAPQSAQAPAPETTASVAPPQPNVAGNTTSAEGWDDSGSAKLGKPLPEFELEKVGGGKIEASSLRGRWTVLALWSASDAASLA